MACFDLVLVKIPLRALSPDIGTMSLSKFIRDNNKTILREWEEFAATLVPSAQKSDLPLLRDHAKQILEAIAADLARPQTVNQKKEKSLGHADEPNKKTAAKEHGIQRLAAGFSLNAAMAEYRALRASVIRLWQAGSINESTPVPNAIDEDLIRFNEEIDQAIYESVLSYSAERDLQTRMLDTVLSSSPDLIFIFNLDGAFAYANKAWIELSELSLAQLEGKSFSDLGLPNAADLLQQIQQVIGTKEQYHGEMSYTAPSGQWGFYDCIFMPVLNEDGAVEAVAGTARNITERKAMEDENWRKANYDILTGLPNRQLFRDRLEQDVKHAGRIGEPIALLFIDLDHFKEANDQFGHDTGDVLLRLAAERIRSCVREADTVARLGGDEFTVILHDLKDAEQAEIVAGKIVKEIANSFEVSNEIIHISASVGIAVSSQDDITPEHLIKNADLAMYVAKKAGSNRFISFSPTSG